MITKIEESIQDAAGLEKKREALIQQIGSLESQIAALTNVCNTLRTLIESDEQHCPTCYQQVEREVLQQIIDEKGNRKIAPVHRIGDPQTIIGDRNREFGESPCA